MEQLGLDATYLFYLDALNTDQSIKTFHFYSQSALSTVQYEVEYFVTRNAISGTLLVGKTLMLFVRQLHYNFTAIYMSQSSQYFVLTIAIGLEWSSQHTV